jgi:hypothetical protein
MSVLVIKESSDFFTVKISGIFTYQDMKAIEETGGSELPRDDKIKILVVAKEFSGWGKGGDWGDLTFMYQNDQYIEKIAIVADEKWRQEFLMFIGAGRRQAAVEFFLQGEEDEARAWLAESIK